MIVYGDIPLAARLVDYVDCFARRLKHASTSIDELRVRLVLAGQLQQASEDAGLDCAGLCSALTFAAAQDFIASNRSSSSDQGQRLLTLLKEIRQIAARADVALTIKTPEGFAWYALYPEAYAQAADGWAASSFNSGRVLVIGIRSIGTTLAAMVAAVLARRGITVASLTVRPYGHPFRRSTALPSDLPVAEHVLIVDEGPGQSGSSMASVAEALATRGFNPERLTFFPGHEHGPGPQATSSARRWWSTVPLHCVPVECVQIESRPLGQALIQSAEQMLAEPLHNRLADLGAGRWLTEANHPADSVMASAPYLEQPKLLARGRSGRGVLFKFTGFTLAHQQIRGALQTGAERQFAKLSELADRNFTVCPLALAHGWLAIPWLEGKRLVPSDADEPMLERLGSYIRTAAGAPLEPSENESAFERASDMLICNTRALLGDQAAERAHGLVGYLARSNDRLDVPSYGDGRLAPHEWIRSDTGVLKLDAAGHQHDHTAVGRQPIWWDIAGAGIEWKLEKSQLAKYVGFHDIGAETFYRAVYACFRAGIAHMGASIAHETRARRAYENAMHFYRQALMRELK